MLEQIKASAGSGKTYTLTRRFLQVLSTLGGEFDALPCRSMRPSGPGAFSEILAMTFTNKAASEMKARVLSTLKEIALGDQPDPETEITPAEAKAWLETILRRYDSLNIRTIDSLLNLLVKISSMGLDIPPDFELAFDEKEWLEPLYDELLDKAAQGDEEISGLLRECAAYLLNTSKSGGLTPRGRIRKMLLEVLGKIHFETEDRLPCVDRGRIEGLRSALFQQLHETLRGFEAQLERLHLKPSKTFTNFTEKLWALEPGAKFPTSTLLGRDTFTACCNKAEKALVDDELEAAYQDFCLAVEETRRKLAICQSALELLPFARLAVYLLPEVKRLQGESGQITGAQLPFLASEVLNGENGVSEACCRLGSRLNHILIDEFQDTSRAQWQAILPLAEECLSRGGSLRYVGDVKQAIYSWRGGDSSLFDEIAAASSGLTMMEPRPKFTRLAFNWRSAPEVVRHNNEFFSRLADPELAYLVIKALLHAEYPDEWARLAAQTMSNAFSDTAQALPDARRRKGQQGFVRIQKVSGAGQPELMEDIRGKLEPLFQDILGRHAPGDVAVLVRNGTEAALVTEWLANWGVGVVTEHSFKLSGNPLIKRLLSFIRFLDYPPDDLSFMEFIGGAEFFARATGLTPEDLLAWEAGIRKHKKELPLFRYFQRDFPDEWATWIEPFYNRSGLMGPYDFISEIYNRYSLLARAPGHAIYLRRFLELILASEKQGYSSLSGFLEFWEDKGKEEKVPAPDNPDAVRLMTLHKSKGLEFKVVIMPFHRFGGKGWPESALCELGGVPLLIKEGPEQGVDYYRGKNSAAVEAMHLLYVGWTRAGEELHLLVGGSDHDNRSAGLCKAMQLLLADYNFSEDGIYSAGEPSRPKSGIEPPTFDAPQEFKELNTSVEEDWQPMEWLPKLKIFRAPVPELQFNERVRGILFHNCLENLYLPDESLAEVPEIIKKTVEHTMRGYPLPLIEAEKAKAEVEEALLWFCSLPDSCRWLAEGRPEQTIMDETGANHRVDLLVEEPDGSLLVLEYKSGKPRPEYAEQTRCYLDLLNRSGRKARGMLVYLDEKSLEEIDL